MTKKTVEETFENAKKAFTDYLEQHAHRKTPERYTILKEIFATEGHFDIETLYIRMKNHKYRVSRATLYNTIELLLDSNLVIKHQFGRNIAQFERSFKYKQHDHLVCKTCGKVIEFCDPRVQQIQTTISKLMDFNIDYHSLYFYGICSECTNK